MRGVGKICDFWPISHCNYISKILERLFLTRIQSHVFSSPNFNRHQSAYRRNYSTETALLSTTNDFFQSSDTGKSTLLISLDLSAAFDTIDHSILLSRLYTSFGLTGTVYSWLKSYLTDRYQSVHIGQHSSTPTLCTSGVPQGSVLGPLLFTIFTSPVSNIISLHNVHQHQYADDTQLFISLSPTHFSAEISNLTGCIKFLVLYKRLGIKSG